MRLLATKEFTYANRALKVGDSFEANDEDARLLKGWGKATDADSGEQTGDGLFASTSVGGKSKRAYKRRDMVAES